MRIPESIRSALVYLPHLVFQLLLVLAVWVTGLITFVVLRLFILIRKLLGLDKG